MKNLWIRSSRYWGGYWHLETHPDIYYILFNEALNKAKVEFRVGYEGGEAILVKEKGEWIIKKSKMTWIE